MRVLRVVAVASVAAPLVAFATWGAVRYRDTQETAQQRVTDSLRAAHEHASQVFRGAESLQDQLFAALNGKRLTELRDIEPFLHETLQASLKEQPAVGAIWIIGADAKPIASSLSFPAPEVDFSGREHFRFHQDAWKGRYLSKPLPAENAQERIADVSIRFNDPDGNFGGVISVSLPTARFQRFYSDLVGDDPGLAVSLFREDGSVFSQWPLLTQAAARTFAGSPLLRRVSLGDPSRRGGAGGAQDRLSAFRRVGDYPLFVGTGMEAGALRNEWLRELGTVLAFGVPPFVLLFLGATFGMRRLRRAAVAAPPAIEQDSLPAPVPVYRQLGKTVLLVEPSDPLAETFVGHLVSIGCDGLRVETASAGSEWLAAQTQLPDLVMTEITMPTGIDGLSLARSVRTRWPSLPVLLVAPYGEEIDPSVKREFEVVRRPCSAQVLSAAIQRAAKK